MGGFRARTVESGSTKTRPAPSRLEPLERRVLFDLTPVGDVFRAYEQREEPSVIGPEVVRSHDVAMDADGEFTFAWETDLPLEFPSRRPQFQLFGRPAVPAGNAVEADNRSLGGVSPRLAMDRDGDFVAVWYGGTFGLSARLFQADGNDKGPSFAVSNEATPFGPDFSVAMNPQGQFVIAWRHDATTLRAQRFTPDGAPDGEPIRVNASGGAAMRYGVAVAMDHEGGFAAAWVQHVQGATSVMTRRFFADGRVDFRESTVAQADGGVGAGPWVGSAADGRFVVLWADNAGLRAKLYFASGAARSVPFVIEPAAAGGPLDGVDLAAEADGDFLVTWRTGKTIYGKQYNGAGQPDGEKVAIAEARVTTGGATRVSIDGGGTRAVVGWTDGEARVDAFYHTLEGRLVTAPSPGGGPGSEPPPPPPPGNTPPETSGVPDVTVDQDAPDTVVPLFDSFSDAQDGDAAMRYGLAANTNVALFSGVLIDNATGLMTLDYAPGASGVAVLTLRVTDTPGESVTTSFTVTVRATTPVPPPPPPPPEPDPVPTPNPGPVGSPPSPLGNGSFAGRVVTKAKKRKPAGLAGVAVFVDADYDGTFDAGELSATTDAAGRYAFTGLAAGRYRVRMLEMPAGHTVAGRRPDGGLRDVLLRAKQRKTAKVKPVVLNAPVVQA